MVPGNNLLLELFTIFVWAKVFAEVFEHLLLPAVLGEIVAGAVLGPYAFGVIAPSATTHSLAQLGAVFLLFAIGLETLPKQLVQVARESLVVALSGVVLSFLFAFGYLALTGYHLRESTFVAAALVASSAGITARSLADIGVLETRPARIILGSAVFDDILGMLLLAVVVGALSAGSVKWVATLVLALEAAGLALFMLFVAPRVIQRIQPRIREITLRNAPLVVALALCLALSAAAERIGIAAIIGAFFAGLAFAEYSSEWNLKASVHGISDFLAPFFFFTAGAQLNVGLFSSKMLIAAIGLSAVAVLSKVLGCGLPVLRLGLRDAMLVGVGMIPRGEVTLIVALLGVQMTLINPQTYALIVFISAITTLVAPVSLRFLYSAQISAYNAQASAAREPKPKLTTQHWSRLVIRTAAGFVACTSIAVFSSLFYHGRIRPEVLPLYFIILLAVVALFFGRAAGIAGTLGSALVFAFLLLQPIGSWRVTNEAARVNLSWMLLAGTGLSYFIPQRRLERLPSEGNVYQRLKAGMSRTAVLLKRRGE